MKSHIFIFILGFFALVACDKEKWNDVEDPGWNNGQDSKELTIMSYNIRHCAPYQVENAKPDIDAIAAIIKKVKPDVVFLQEVDKNTNRSGNVDQLEELSKKTGLTFKFFGKGQDYQGGEFGCAFLSRLSLTDTKVIVYPLAETQTTGRIMIQAAIRFNDKPITLACTHLGIYQEDQDVEIPYLKSKLLETSPYPVILGGDFNAVPENKTITTLLGYGFIKTNSFTTFTIPSDKPNRQLDYIMYSPANKFRLISHTVLPDKFSDHLPVVAKFELP